jgi:hypothetical protein
MSRNVIKNSFSNFKGKNFMEEDFIKFLRDKNCSNLKCGSRRDSGNTKFRSLENIQAHVKAKKRREGGSDEGERVEVKESKNDDGEDYFDKEELFMGKGLWKLWTVDEDMMVNSGKNSKKMTTGGAFLDNLSVKRGKLLQWGFILVFLFSYLCGVVLLPQKAEAVTRAQALEYRKKLGMDGYPYVVRSNGTLVSWDWNGAWRTVPEHVRNNVATKIGDGDQAAVIKRDGSIVYFYEDPHNLRPTEAKSDVLGIFSKTNGAIMLKPNNILYVWSKRPHSIRDYWYIDQSENISDIMAVTSVHRLRYIICGLKTDKRTIVELHPIIFGNPYSSGYYVTNTHSVSDDIVDIVGGNDFSTSYCYELHWDDDVGYRPVYGGARVSPLIGLKEDGKVINWMKAQASYHNYIYDHPYPEAGIPDAVNCTCASCGPIVDIAGNRAFFVALKGNGGVVAWRYKKIPGDPYNFKEHAEPELLTVPQEVQSGVLAIQANNSSNYAMALKADGSIIVWDVNGNLRPVPEGLNVLNEAPNNAVPVVEITGLANDQRIRKSENILEFRLKVTDDDTADANLETEIYIGIFGSYQKITEFTVDGVQNTAGKLTAQNGTEYTITLNKGVLVPMYANEFTIKVIATDTCSEKGEKELTLVHYTDILAQWSLDSVKERIAVDSGGQSNHGVIHGATLTTGIISNALEFDGTNDYVEVPLSPALTITTSSFSIEAWVKTTDVPLANDGIVGNYRTTTTPYWMLSHCGDTAAERGKFGFSVRDQNAVVANIKTGAPLNDGQWHHLVGVRDAAQNKVALYVDGALVGEAAAPSGDVNSGQSIYIGEHMNRYFQGCIDEVTLYGCALSAQEIKQNYQKIVFLENLKITNRYNEETRHLGTFGTHMNKIEFDLTKTINKLVLELNLPSNLKVVNIESVSKDGELIENPVTDIMDGNKIVLEQPLTAGHYKIEFFVFIDNQLIVKTESYSDEKDIKTNYESEEFRFDFSDLKSLPDVT